MAAQFPLPKIVEKPWGREIWFAHNEQYAGKILEVKAGKRLSLQYHEIKHETMYLLQGRMYFVYGNDVQKPEELSREEFAAPRTIIIPPHTIHRVEAIDDIVLVEVSTPQLDDVVRLSDDYGRSG